MKYQLIVLFGPPGSGKGTQANILEKDYSYVQLGMSKMLVDYAERMEDVTSEHERVERIQMNFKNGDLVGFEDVVTIMEMNFTENMRKGLQMTLDGFPRTENQAIWLSGLITKEKIKTLFIHFELGLQTVLDRIENRYFVEGSKEIFSSYEEALKSAPTGTKPFKRELDTDKNIIVKRFNEQYDNDKLEIVQGLVNNPFVEVLNINAIQPIDKITDQIKKKLIQYNFFG
ncbi:MAG: nucleoside monophosphate kinase [Patescibacteria group bacterium]